ncbi:alpha/beta hydrolase family protein [Amycolatopsis nigrescens]|uniref:alpha/beta hydrolase family protein n=1 Tax=Amycolatopsis nigrescens TaxID=381445 RepID=UPI00036F56CF|nr:hypothetical protein [Amycolatopsis nigrescens]
MRLLLPFLLVASLLTAAPAVAAPAKTGFTLPAPTGRYAVGSTELHLVQPDRPDPWLPAKPRELMTSVWYPALRTGLPLAPYVPPALAEHYDTEPPIGLPAGRVDWAGVRGHARTGAPVLGGPGGFPVVLYSPGVGNSRVFGTVLAEELASRGYVVVGVDHTYETTVAFPGGRVEPDSAFDLTDPNDPDAIERAKQRLMDAREYDSRFVLDQLETLAAGGNPDAERRALPAGLGRALDLSEVGMFGHSGGGVTSSRVVQADRRVDAGVNMDGWYSFGDNRPELGVDRPFLLMGAGSSPDLPPLYGKPRTHLTEPDWGRFWRASTGWQLDLNVPAGRHYTFTDAQWFLPQLAGPLGLDLRDSIGTVDPVRIVDAQRAYLTAFFDQHLKHRPQPLLRGPSPEYPQVEFIR